MSKKVLIIEDEQNEYKKIRKWIVKDLRFKNEDVIPNNGADIQEMLIASKSDEDIKEFVEKQIRMHYKDFVLILCDLRFIYDNDGGSAIVNYIRNLKGFTPSNWATMVPIIGMTDFANSGTSIKDIIKAGADYGFEKIIVTENQTVQSKEKEILKAIISTRIKLFTDNLKCIYPLELKKKITENKKNQKTAFIMSAFRHNDYIEMAKDVLKSHGIIPLVAKGRVGEFDDKVWDNIVIHMNMCDFGIAIYADDSLDNRKDNKERDKMNPNVSIEVGYLLGLQKKVLFLKHDNLPKLPSDFGGEHYAAFNNYETIKSSISEWLEKRGLAPKSDTGI